MTNALTFGVAAVLSWLFVWSVRRYALRSALLDHPTDRSSHSAPTPRGGGLGMIVAFFLAFGLLVLWPHFDWRLALALSGVGLTAVVGWRDDHGGLPVGLRLAAHLAAGVMLVPLAHSPSPIPSWLGIGAAFWWVFWTVSAINVVNFMDGIDGIIGLQAVVFGLHLVSLGGASGLARPYGLALGGAALGFLMWNWSPARIFMGDVGSGALGAAMVLGGLILLRERDLGLAAAYLPLYPIFLDAAVTLVARVGRGERLTVPHRTHLYQKLANGGWGHARVSALYGCVSLAGSALVWSQQESHGVTIALYFVSVATLGFFLQRVGRHGTSGAAAGPS